MNFMCLRRKLCPLAAVLRRHIQYPLGAAARHKWSAIDLSYSFYKINISKIHKDGHTINYKVIVYTCSSHFITQIINVNAILQTSNTRYGRSREQTMNWFLLEIRRLVQVYSSYVVGIKCLLINNESFVRYVYIQTPCQCLGYIPLIPLTISAVFVCTMLANFTSGNGDRDLPLAGGDHRVPLPWWTRNHMATIATTSFDHVRSEYLQILSTKCTPPSFLFQPCNGVAK